jgi:hypothetical protein
METAKVRCRVCGWERDVFVPFTPADEDAMRQHVSSHGDTGESIAIVRKSLLDESEKRCVEIEILERWYAMEDLREDKH